MAWYLYSSSDSRWNSNHLFESWRLAGNQAELYPLTFTVDNTPPIITANITPNRVKLGNTALINAISDPDTTSVSAQILGTSYQLTNNGDGTWSLNYSPTGKIFEGTYNISLTAVDHVGNSGTASLNFTIDGIPKY